MKISVQSLFEDYEDDTVELRRAAVAQVQLLRPDGTPLANTGVTLRGGVYRNRLAAGNRADAYCPGARFAQARPPRSTARRISPLRPTPAVC